MTSESPSFDWENSVERKLSNRDPNREYKPMPVEEQEEKETPPRKGFFKTLFSGKGKK